MTSQQPAHALSVEGLTKDFPGVRAVDDVSFAIERNTVHCLVGENGAGKSTLVKMLTGALQPTSGTMTVRGVPYQPSDPHAARAGGIATLFQELHVVDQLTVQENLTLGMERTRFGFLTRSELDDRVVQTLAAIEPSIDPSARVSTLSVAQKQIVEIARAASSGASVIIMDEPTAALSEREVERLFGVIRRLRESDVTVVYISHKLDEIFELGDAVTVLRDGRHIATKPLSAVAGRSELIEMMIGRTVFHGYEPRERDGADTVLTADGLRNHLLRDVSFDIERGEVVGFYGLVGAGKTEIARALFGADKLAGGSITFKGRRVGRAPRDAIAAGIALVPEERRTQGLFTRLTIRRNVPVMNMRRLSRRGIIRSSDERAVAVEYVQKLRIATDSIDKSVDKLSGGNQQKVVLSKCLLRTPTCCCSMSRRVGSTSAPRQRSTTSSGAWPTRAPRSRSSPRSSRRCWASATASSCSSRARSWRPSGMARTSIRARIMDVVTGRRREPRPRDGTGAGGIRRRRCWASVVSATRPSSRILAGAVAIGLFVVCDDPRPELLPAAHPAQPRHQQLGGHRPGRRVSPSSWCPATSTCPWVAPWRCRGSWRSGSRSRPVARTRWRPGWACPTGSPSAWPLGAPSPSAP